MFATFADKHSHLFSDDCDAEATENKLEYTEVYQEFQQIFEKKIEGRGSMIKIYRSHPIMRHLHREVLRAHSEGIAYS